MKILSNPESDSMICVLPNGVTVEVTLVSMRGTKTSSEQSVDEVMSVVKRLPHTMLSNKQSVLF